MGSNAEPLSKSLSQLELLALARALELCFPADAIVAGVWWPGTDAEHRNYRLVISPSRASGEPLGTWLIERRGNVYRMRTRPLDADEIQIVLEALREVAAVAPDANPRIAEALYDCTEHTYELRLTALEQMRESVAYERWILRRHPDQRPLSVGYVLETRRERRYVSLPGGATLRGSPWSD